MFYTIGSQMAESLRALRAGPLVPKVFWDLQVFEKDKAPKS
jgi:hypothetical protein